MKIISIVLIQIVLPSSHFRISSLSIEEGDGIPADNKDEKPCDIQDDDQNVEHDNQNEEHIQGNDQNANETCSVCLANIPDTRIGHCPHKFCKGCIDNWKIDKRIYRCPLCNEEYDNPDYQEDSDSSSNDTNDNMTSQDTANDWLTILRTDNLNEAIRNVHMISDILVNILSEVMRNINTTSGVTANHMSEAIRNINTTTDNNDSGSQVLVNMLSEAMRNTNTTSVYTANDLHEAIRNINATRDNIVNMLSEDMTNTTLEFVDSNWTSNDRNVNMTFQETPDNLNEAIRTNELSEDIGNSNTTTDNNENNSRDLINDLTQAIRNINATRDNIVDNTDSQETSEE